MRGFNEVELFAFACVALYFGYCVICYIKYKRK